MHPVRWLRGVVHIRPTAVSRHFVSLSHPSLVHSPSPPTSRRGQGSEPVSGAGTSNSTGNQIDTRIGFNVAEAPTGYIEKLRNGEFTAASDLLNSSGVKDTPDNPILVRLISDIVTMDSTERGDTLLVYYSKRHTTLANYIWNFKVQSKDMSKLGKDAAIKQSFEILTSALVVEFMYRNKRMKMVEHVRSVETQLIQWGYNKLEVDFKDEIAKLQKEKEKLKEVHSGGAAPVEAVSIKRKYASKSAAKPNDRMEEYLKKCKWLEERRLKVAMDDVVEEMAASRFLNFVTVLADTFSSRYHFTRPSPVVWCNLIKASVMVRKWDVAKRNLLIALSEKKILPDGDDVASIIQQMMTEGYARDTAKVVSVLSWCLDNELALKDGLRGQIPKILESTLSACRNYTGPKNEAAVIARFIHHNVTKAHGFKMTWGVYEDVLITYLNAADWISASRFFTAGTAVSDGVEVTEILEKKISKRKRAALAVLTTLPEVGKAIQYVDQDKWRSPLYTQALQVLGESHDAFSDGDIVKKVLMNLQAAKKNEDVLRIFEVFTATKVGKGDKPPAPIDHHIVTLVLASAIAQKNLDVSLSLLVQLAAANSYLITVDHVGSVLDMLVTRGDEHNIISIWDFALSRGVYKDISVVKDSANVNMNMDYESMLDIVRFLRDKKSPPSVPLNPVYDVSRFSPSRAVAAIIYKFRHGHPIVNLFCSVPDTLDAIENYFCKETQSSVGGHGSYRLNREDYRLEIYCPHSKPAPST